MLAKPKPLLSKLASKAVWRVRLGAYIALHFIGCISAEPKTIILSSHLRLLNFNTTMSETSTEASQAFN